MYRVILTLLLLLVACDATGQGWTGARITGGHATGVGAGVGTALPPVGDITAPTPDPSTWSSVPNTTGTSTIEMTADTATDATSPPVEYSFECTTGGCPAGGSSGWQAGAYFEATGLTASTLYSFRHQSRDSASTPNETAYSSTLSDTTDAPSTNPITVDRGDLDIPIARITIDGVGDTGTSRWYQPPAIPDTSGWQQFDMSTYMSGCDLADNGTDDESCVDAAVTAAKAGAAGGVVLNFEAGTYNFQGNQTIDINRDNFVIRCADPATTILKWHAGHEGNLGSNGNYYNGYLHFRGPVQGAGASETWAGGFTEGETDIEVAAGTGSTFSVDDYVQMNMTSSGTDCYGQDNADVTHSFRQIAQVTGISTDTLTIDRPLRMDYTDTGAAPSDCSGAKTVTVMNMSENIGIENCSAVHDDPISIRSFQGQAMNGVVNSWATNNRFGDWQHTGWFVVHTRDVLFAHNEFFNINGYRTGGKLLDIKFSTDTYVIDNWAESFNTGFEVEGGQAGAVLAYNTMLSTYPTPDPAVSPDDANDPAEGDRQCGNFGRAIFFHGKYAREVLVESNVANCAMADPDTYYNRQGPRNIAYKNRHLPNEVSIPYGKAVHWNTHDDGGETEMADQFSWVGNIGSWFAFGPTPVTPAPTNAYYNINKLMPNAWLEKNVATTGFTIAAEGTNGNDCGWRSGDSGTGGCGTHSGSAHYRGDNYGGSDTAPAAWSGFSAPSSLFMAARPDWWCDEACTWGSNTPGWGDDIGSGWYPTWVSMCKLPSHIRHDGGACTCAHATLCDP